MIVKVIDLNDEHVYDEWKKLNRDKVYVYDIKEIYISRGQTDGNKDNIYIFYSDDGKDKHESYELNFVIPDRNIDEIFYGEDKDEVNKKLKQWLNEHLMLFIELYKLLGHV